MHQIASFKTKFSEKLQLWGGLRPQTSPFPGIAQVQRADRAGGANTPFGLQQFALPPFENCSAAYIV